MSEMSATEIYFTEEYQPGCGYMIDLHDQPGDPRIFWHDPYVNRVTLNLSHPVVADLKRRRELNALKALAVCCAAEHLHRTAIPGAEEFGEVVGHMAQRDYMQFCKGAI